MGVRGGGGSTESGGEILARSQSARVVRAVSLQEEEEETQGLPVRHSQTPERASERAALRTLPPRLSLVNEQPAHPAELAGKPPPEGTKVFGMELLKLGGLADVT